MQGSCLFLGYNFTCLYFLQRVIDGGVQAHHRKSASASLPLLSNSSSGVAERWRLARGSSGGASLFYAAVAAALLAFTQQNLIGWVGKSEPFLVITSAF